MALEIFSLNSEFSNRKDLLLAILGKTMNNAGFATCLVSPIDFKGNARFRLGDLFVYPSIQASVWSACLGELSIKTSAIPAELAKNFIRWPALSPDVRRSLATETDLPYYSASATATPTKRFNDIVSELFELAQDFVIPQIEPSYMSIEKYVELWKEDPVSLLYSEENPEIAMGSRVNLDAQVQLLKENHRTGSSPDFTRLMLEKLTDVLTQQNKFPQLESDSPVRYMTIMESLGIQRAIISDAKLDLPYLRTKNKGKTFTVYFNQGAHQ